MTVPLVSPELDSVWLTESDIRSRVRELGLALAEDHRERVPLFVSLLRSGTVFLADLVRAAPLEVELDFMSVSSYGGLRPGGAVRVLKDLDTAIEGRDVVVVEGIVDTGLTLGYVLGSLWRRGPRSLSVCALLDRERRRMVDVGIAYRGFYAPDRYLVGYGLDYRGAYRNLPFVGALKEGTPDVPGHDTSGA